MRYRSMNIFNDKKILKMLFLGPRRIPSHKVHSHSSNGSRKERKLDSFFSLLSMVFVAVLSLSLFSVLISSLTYHSWDPLLSLCSGTVAQPQPTNNNNNQITCL